MTKVIHIVVVSNTNAPDDHAVNVVKVFEHRIDAENLIKEKNQSILRYYNYNILSLALPPKLIEVLYQDLLDKEGDYK